MMLSRSMLTLLLVLCSTELISGYTTVFGAPRQLHFQQSSVPLVAPVAPAAPTPGPIPGIVPGAIPISQGSNPFSKYREEQVEVTTIVRTPADSPIEVHGSKFFVKSTGEQFFMKGIAYQPSRVSDGEVYAQFTNSKFIDPMAEADICLRDLPYLKKLGVNVVRVYSIDTEREHDLCFQAFAEAGIYVIADLSEPDISIVRESPTWDITIFDRYTKVVDALHQYQNLLGFFAGNEVTNDRTNTDASPFVKASIRDVKAYIKEKGYRSIPVGYSTNDDAETRQSIADYFACGQRENTADFYGVNMYEWCGYSTYWSSGYKDRTEEFKDYPVPVFFSEFGCNIKRPRPFTEIEALYGRLMTGTWSGGIAYMYFEEPNQYGVTEIVGGQVKELDDFEYLRRQYQQAFPSGPTLEEYKKKATFAKIPNCPLNTRSWGASTKVPPTPDATKCGCLESSLQCKLSPYVNVNELDKIFTYACGIIDCSDIRGNGTTGEYGAFSDCAAKQKASYLINEVYKQIGGGDPTNCGFKGLAVYNNRVANQKELEGRFTITGDSCFSVLSKHGEIKVEQEFRKLKDLNATANGSTASGGSGSSSSGALHNRAGQLQFYNNLFNTVGLTSIFVILVSIFA